MIRPEDKSYLKEKRIPEEIISFKIFDSQVVLGLKKLLISFYRKIQETKDLKIEKQEYIDS